jgi:hypothetical protein
LLDKSKGNLAGGVNKGAPRENNNSEGCLTKGGKPKLKSMYEFTKLLKRKAIIQNEIMIHFGHPKLTDNN